MTPILCISKSDMPRMMYELGKASNVYIDTVFAVICFIIMIFFVTQAIRKVHLLGCLFCAIIFLVLGSIFVKYQYDYNKQYRFSNFAYNQPSKFILQYYTVTTWKEYKFIAETKNNVFIKEIKKCHQK